MSYCRSNGRDSDVYLIGTAHSLECFGAGWELEAESPVHDRFMAPSWGRVDGEIVPTGEFHEAPKSYTTVSRSEMIDHLLAHRAAGHKVPDYAIERLQKEISEAGDAY